MSEDVMLKKDPHTASLKIANVSCTDGTRLLATSEIQLPRSRETAREPMHLGAVSQFAGAAVTGWLPSCSRRFQHSGTLQDSMRN